MAQSAHSASTRKMDRPTFAAILVALSSVVVACSGGGEDYTEIEEAVRQALAQDGTIPVELVDSNGDSLYIHTGWPPRPMESLVDNVCDIVDDAGWPDDGYIEVLAGNGDVLTTCGTESQADRGNRCRGGSQPQR